MNEWRFGDQFQSQSLLLQYGPKFPDQSHNSPDLRLVMCHMLGPKIQLVTVSGLPKSEDVGDTDWELTQRVRGKAAFYFLYNVLPEKNKQQFHVCSAKNISAKADLI